MYTALDVVEDIREHLSLHQEFWSGVPMRVHIVRESHQ